MSLAAVEEVGQEINVPEGIELLNLSPIIGTEVHGIDLRDRPSDEMVTFLKNLLLERKVIFFRDQDITVEQHMDICRIWGELEIIDFLPQHEKYPEVLHIKRDKTEKASENVWHSDVSWRECPSFGSMLRAVEVPEVGGDTLFACMYTAYERLPDALKRAVEGLEAVHSVANGLRFVHSAETMRKALEKYPPQTHPVVRTHPATRRKTLYVNRAHTSHLRKVVPHIGTQLLDMLYRQADIPELQCRFRWQKNSIAFWDNRACQHYAAADYFPEPREMYRVTIVGDRPY